MPANSTGRTGVRVIASAFFVLALALMSGALMDAISTLQLLHGRAVADGTIVAMEMVHRVRRNGYKYMPVVRFTMQNGQTFTVQSNKGSNPPAFKVGDAVKVYYDPDHPEHALINTFEQLWAGDTVVGSVGVLMLGMGGLFLGGGSAARQRYAVTLGGQPLDQSGPQI